MNRPLTTILLAAALLAPALPAFADQPPRPPRPAPRDLPDWKHLSPAQRETLIASLQQRWDDAPKDQRDRMLRHAERWQSMTPEQRAKAREGMHRYENMSPEQRRQARALFEQMRALPPEQRQQLRERWKQMTPQQREDWVRAHDPDGDRD